MSIDLPKGLDCAFDAIIEDLVYDRMDAWLDSEPRSPGLHASGLLDPKMTYWDQQDPHPRTRIETDRFFLGKLGEAMIISMLEGLKDTKGKPMVKPYVGGKQQHSEEFGISYAPDWAIKKVPLEIKSTRKWKVDTTIDDIRYYVEQCLVYMTILQVLKFHLLIHYYAVQENNKVVSKVRIVTLTMTAEDLAFMTKQLHEKIYHVKQCFEQEKPDLLHPCREWKCGERICSHWDVCQPVGRYGKLYRDWEPSEPIEMFEKPV